MKKTVLVMVLFGLLLKGYAQEKHDTVLFVPIPKMALLKDLKGPGLRFSGAFLMLSHR